MRRRICLTPPMGWNSWNCWGLSVSDEKVRQSADNYVNKGLMNHGWTYITSTMVGNWYTILLPENVVQFKIPGYEKFGRLCSLKRLEIRNYSSPGPKTCGMYEASYGYENNDAQLFGEWESIT